MSDDSEISTREINRYTLVGDYERLFVSLLKVRHPDVAHDPDQIATLFGRHIHRGIALLANRVKSPAAVLDLVSPGGTSAVVEKR